MKEDLNLKHSLTINERTVADIKGVSEVTFLNENEITVMTTEGELTFEGSDLHISSFSSDNGVLYIHGMIDGMYYAESKGEQPNGKKRRK